MRSKAQRERERALCRYKYHVHSAVLYQRVEVLLLMSDAIPVRDWRLHPNGSTRTVHLSNSLSQLRRSTSPIASLTHQLGGKCECQNKLQRVEFPVRLSLPLSEESVTNGMLRDTPRAPHPANTGSLLSCSCLPLPTTVPVFPLLFPPQPVSPFSCSFFSPTFPSQQKDLPRANLREGAEQRTNGTK